MPAAAASSAGIADTLMLLRDRLEISVEKMDCLQIFRKTPRQPELHAAPYDGISLTPLVGIALDPEKNNATGATEATISAPGSRVKVMVIPTNEELVVAREVKRFLEKPARAPSATRATRPRKRAPAST